jgi:hypothetical protein
VWATPIWTPLELNHLMRRIVWFLAHDEQTNTSMPLGSGFIVAVNQQMLVLSAAHNFVDWLERVRPYNHPLRGVDYEADAADFARRFRPLMLAGSVHAMVYCTETMEPHFCALAHICLAHDPLRNDTALVQMLIPDGVREQDLGVMLIDDEPIDIGAPAFMAGYTGGRIIVRREDNAVMRAKARFDIRVGNRGPLVQAAEGYRGIAMWRLNFPSLGGMSGGPVMAVRPVRAPVAGPGPFRESLPTAVGIVSRGRIGEPLLPDHCVDGETWASPISYAFGQTMHTDDGPMTLAEAIQRQVVPRYSTLMI